MKIGFSSTLLIIYLVKKNSRFILVFIKEKKSNKDACNTGSKSHKVWRKALLTK